MQIHVKIKCYKNDSIAATSTLLIIFFSGTETGVRLDGYSVTGWDTSTLQSVKKSVAIVTISWGVHELWHVEGHNKLLGYLHVHNYAVGNSMSVGQRAINLQVSETA